MRLPHLAVLAATFALAACTEKSPLDDTLLFPPGVDVQYKGESGKLYGTSQCGQAQLSGNTCLIFPPHNPTVKGVIISGQRVQEVELSVRKDPKNPIYYIVEDQNGEFVISSTGRHDEFGNIDIRPVELKN